MMMAKEKNFFFFLNDGDGDREQQFIFFLKDNDGD